MATTAARRSSSKKSTNGSAHAGQALKAMSRRASTTSRSLQGTISRESEALLRRGGELLQAAVSGTRRHPYIAAGAVATVAALLGGALWYRKR
jgi:ElaB/YqjD/DUF883 family membrane-anchored ribosome-binding protein